MKRREERSPHPNSDQNYSERNMELSKVNLRSGYPLIHENLVSKEHYNLVILMQYITYSSVTVVYLF